MKPMLLLLAAAAGLLVSLGSFGAGLAFAVYMIAVEPPRPQGGLTGDVADLWTAEPRRVAPEAKDLERVAAAPVSDNTSASLVTPAAAEAVDPTETASVKVESDALHSERTALAEAHVEWCADRYRSYRPRDNSYTPYSGGRRECVSPFSESLADGLAAASPFAAVDLAADETSPEPLAYGPDSTAAGQIHLDADHIDYCFSRYRSYRPEDNSYQPYGGGPRRQCR